MQKTIMLQDLLSGSSFDQLFENMIYSEDLRKSIIELISTQENKNTEGILFQSDALKVKTFLKDCAYLLNDKRSSLSQAIEAYLDFLEKTLLNKDKIWNLESYLLRSAFLIGQLSNNKHSKTTSYKDRYMEVINKFYSEQDFIKIYTSNLLGDKTLLNQNICDFYDKFTNRMLSGLKEIRVFFDNEPPIFEGCVCMFFITKEVFREPIELEVVREKLIDNLYKIQSNFVNQVKEYLGDFKYRKLQHKIIDFHKMLLESCNVALPPENWVLAIAQRLKRDRELSDFAKKLQTCPEKNKAMWENAVYSRIPINQLEQIHIEQFSSFEKTFKHLVSLTEIEPKKRSLVDFMVNSGIIIEQENLSTGESRTPVLSVNERYIVKIRDYLVSQTILKNSFKKNEISDCIESLFPKNHDFPFFIKKEIQLCIQNLFALKDNGNDKSKDFSKRLFIDRLVTLIEPLIVSQTNLRPDKRGLTKSEKPRHKKGLEIKLNDIIGKALTEVFIIHRNDIAHPSQQLVSLSHYFVFAIILKILSCLEKILILRRD